jgi:hypothetical protein
VQEEQPSEIISIEINKLDEVNPHVDIQVERSPKKRS